MIKIILMLSLLAGSTTALADGFVCHTPGNEVKIQMYNHVKPDLGTRTAAVMVISDSREEIGNKTLAIIRDEAGALVNDGASYLGYLGLRDDAYLNSEVNILGKSIGDIYSTVVRIDFSYERPVPHGTWMEGELVIVERNADRSYVDLRCQRYLKSHKNSWNLDM